MAVNQVSLFFYSPGWQQRLTTPDPMALTDQGTPLQIAGVERVPDADAPAVQTAEVRAWLVERGFTPAEWSRDLTFHRGRVRTMFGLEKEIEICLGDQGGEIADLYCRFTLHSRTPPPLAEWAGLMADLCGRFGVRLRAEGTAPCDAAEFVAAVHGNHNYRRFAALFGWDAAQAPPDAAGL